MSRKLVTQGQTDDVGLYTLATFQTLRLEAIDLFDRSLTENCPDYLERFIQVQVAQEFIPLELLSQVAEDVHQRLLKLRQRYFETRDELRQTLLHQYGFDLAPFMSGTRAGFHRLDLEAALCFFQRQQPLADDEIFRTIRRLLLEAQSDGARLFTEIHMAEALYAYLMDWLLALHVVSVRGSWADDYREERPQFVH